ncbi:MAG: hypothetical protein PHU40_00195 [Sulfurimonas sp.]|nr:hypothetical protein [Sulfurimonas sp.]
MAEMYFNDDIDEDEYSDDLNEYEDTEDEELDEDDYYEMDDEEEKEENDYCD